jgi:4-hydroxy-4-methyl-2-oxoglutarate aldolase
MNVTRPQIQTLGRLPAEAFGSFTLRPIDPALIAGYRALSDLTGMVSDAMDELGLFGSVPRGMLRPTEPSARLVSRALTVLNVKRDDLTPNEVLNSGKPMLADIEAHNLAEPGDVLVLQGVDMISNMGGILASIAKRQGELGAIVDGAVRDVSHSREIGYPVWSRSVSPITGKWRIRTVSINKPVEICGIAVMPGDLVLADEVGVCFVPFEHIAKVLAHAQDIAESEEIRQQAINEGAAIRDVMQRKPKA